MLLLLAPPILPRRSRVRYLWIEMSRDFVRRLNRDICLLIDFFIPVIQQSPSPKCVPSVWLVLGSKGESEVLPWDSML